MPLTIHSEAPPLVVDESGTIRVGATRIPLDTVVQAFLDGATPEQIVQDFDSLSLEDVYATISYYLGHRPELDAYLAERERQSGQLRERVTAAQSGMPDIRARLLAKRPL